MDYEKSENRFPQWAADAAMSRYVGRQRKFLASSPERKHHNRVARTWSYACVAALNKLRFRRQNVFRESRAPEPWDFVISRQRRKLARKIDLAAAWADAEYRILERFHGRVTAVWRPQDSRWDRVLARQRRKQARLANMPRHQTTESGRESWKAVKWRRVQPATRKLGSGDGTWQAAVTTQLEKARNYTKQNGWYPVATKA